MHRQGKRKTEKPRKEDDVNTPENDAEIQLIEPQVETIELEEDDEENLDNEEKKSHTEKSSTPEDNNKSISGTGENLIVENKLNSESVAKSESDDDDDILELDGLSDMEETYIPHEKENENEYSESVNEKSTEETPETNVNEILPKITNIVGNIVQPIEITDKEEINTNVEVENDMVNAKSETMFVENLCTESKNMESVNEKSTEETPETNVNEILPKITNIVGNIFQPIELTDKEEINTNLEVENNIINAKSETMFVENQCTENKNSETLHCDSDDEMDEILREKANNLMSIEITQIKSECNPDSEISTVQRNTNSFENIHKDEESDSENDPTCSSNRISISDSEDDIDKILQEKANKYIGISPPQINVDITEKNLHENPNTTVIDIDDEDMQANLEINEENEIVEEDIIKKEKHDDDFDEIGIDDDQIEFADDGIEFVEEIEGDKKINELKIEPMSDSEDDRTTDVDDNPKIDLKLLMNPTVYTTKLDVMDVFKFIDFTSVNDKKVIECAITESKPFDKQALKDEDIKKFREQTIYGYESDETPKDKKVIECEITESKPFDEQAFKDKDINNFREQTIHGYESDGTISNSDIVQTDEDSAINRVKCTSWLLQKPKNRNYNPIQLCKNPDFNTRLKRLTAGFLSLTRNRVFLKECKPLTIDLHKAFEKKLIDGTLYLKSGDFKSAKSTEADIINDKPVSVLPSAIPGQSMIFTSTTNDISTVVPSKLDNQGDNIPLSTFSEKNTCSERRKIINLPDIDQVRRFNQSLLTAEVTPIRIETKINNTNTCEEPVKTSVVEQPAFVQPITLEPLIKIKQETEVDDKNKLKYQLDNPNYEISSRKEVMASKINDQIINLSNQISEVDNGLLSIDAEKSVQKQNYQKKNKLGRKRVNVDTFKPPQPPNRLTNVPKFSGKLSWSPKYPKNHIVDSLLTTDTLSKILFLLNGDEQEILNCTCKQKRGLKEIHNQHKNSQMEQQKNVRETNAIQLDLTKCGNESDSAPTDNIIRPRTNGPVRHESSRKKTRKRRAVPGSKKQIEQNRNEQGTNTIQMDLSKCDKQGTKTEDVDLTKCDNVLDSASTNNVTDSTTNCHVYQEVPNTKSNKPRATSVENYAGTYCCWARLKIISITKNKQLDPGKHGCTVYRCQCCCRHELVTLTTWKNSNPYNCFKKPNKNSSTIVLSDDEDVTKVTQTDNENATIPDAGPAEPQTASEGISYSVMPALTPVTETIIHPNPANVEAKNVEVQSEIPQRKFSIDCKLQEPTDTENTVLKKPLCKTTVHAAEGHVYNNRVESIRRNSKEQNSPIVRSVLKTDVEKQKNVEKQTLKTYERTLFLNSNQFLNKPSKTPIFLGKNKVLLCSLKNHKVTAPPINTSLPVLPYGVNFVVSNGELTLSIDNGVQLDSEQLSTLPSIMSLVQEQFLKSNIANNIQNHNIPEKNNDVAIVEKDNLTKQIDTTVENSDNTAEIQNKSTQSDKLVSNDESKKAVTEDLNLNLNEGGVSLPLDNVTKGSTQINNQSETVNDEPECSKSIENQVVTETQIENKIIEPQSVIENQVPTQIPEKLLSSSEPRLNDNNTSCENNNANTRKTILSDLMEMSGISAEDTSMVPEVTETSLPAITSLPPNIIPVTRVSAGDVLNAQSNNNTSQNISIAGPYSNLFSFEPTTPLNHLLNCIAQLRPELNAVTSFAELKYVYANGGQFYKLDVDFGTISEIKVLIKKNPEIPVDMTPKTIIDLTDDPGDSENMTCAEFHDIPQDKQDIQVKPIKLFKAVHPTILKRGRSILKGNEVVYPKKVIRVTKQKRKQLLNVGNRYVLIDVEDESAKPVDPPVSQMDSSYDSSDEEPLAKKSKRKQVAEKNEEETIPLFEDTLEASNPPSVPDDVVDVTDDIADTSDVEMNSMDIEGVNPELHPVAFEEGSESDEDMCILGV